MEDVDPDLYDSYEPWDYEICNDCGYCKSDCVCAEIGEEEKMSTMTLRLVLIGLNVVQWLIVIFASWKIAACVNTFLLIYALGVVVCLFCRFQEDQRN